MEGKPFRPLEIQPWSFGLVVAIGENNKTRCRNCIILGDQKTQRRNFFLLGRTSLDNDKDLEILSSLQIMKIHKSLAEKHASPGWTKWINLLKNMNHLVVEHGSPVWEYWGFANALVAALRNGFVGFAKMTAMTCHEKQPPDTEHMFQERKISHLQKPTSPARQRTQQSTAQPLFHSPHPYNGGRRQRA